VTAPCVEQSPEGPAGRVYLDMRKLDAADDDQVPLAAVVAEEGRLHAINATGPG